MPLAVKLHPFLVHFSIALFITSVVLDWWAVWFKNGKFSTAASVNLFLAAGAVMLAVASGLWARAQLQFTGDAREWLAIHQSLAFWISSGVLGLAFWQIGRGRRMRLPERRLFRLAGLLLLVGMLFVGYQGGKLVFEAGWREKMIQLAPKQKSAPRPAVPGADMYPEEK